MARFYRAEFETQATGSALQWFNCAAASGGMLADQATLGLVDPKPDRVRTLTGDFKEGLTQGALGTALARLDVDVTVYDWNDHLRVQQLVRFLRAGRFAVIAGDYGSLPMEYRADKDYEGDHSVFAHAVHEKGRQPDSISIGDPLGRRFKQWPLSIMKRYVREFDEHTVGGVHATVMDLKKVKNRTQVAGAEIKSQANVRSPVIGVLAKGRTVVTGGQVDGQGIRGNDRWFRVWMPGPKSRIGFIHSSVVERV